MADLLTWAESPTGSVGPTACGGLDQPLQVTVTVVAQGGLGQPPVGPPAHHNAGAMVRRLAYRLASQQRAGHLSAQRERERREREEREREERERRALPSVSAAADQNGQAGRQAGRQRDRERERKTEKERGREREWRHTNTHMHRPIRLGEGAGLSAGGVRLLRVLSSRVAGLYRGESALERSPLINLSGWVVSLINLSGNLSTRTGLYRGKPALE